MDEKKFVLLKEEELGVKEYIKHSLGKGRVSEVSIEYTPVGEKIVVSTNKPGLVIGRRGEKINELTETLRKRFKLDNPHIEIKEIEERFLDAQLVADEIALELERRGPLRFKLTAYKTLKEIMKSGALGAEIVMSGKLPSERARTWRFAQGYLKKTGDPSKVVRRASSQSKTGPGIVGIKVSILPPDAQIHDQITLNEEMKSKFVIGEIEEKEIKKEKKNSRKEREIKR